MTIEAKKSKAENTTLLLINNLQYGGSRGHEVQSLILVFLLIANS